MVVIMCNNNIRFGSAKVIVKITAFLLVVSSLIPLHSAQSGSTNFLQLFLEANNGQLQTSANGTETRPQISFQCRSDLTLINEAVDEHSHWTTKRECQISIRPQMMHFMTKFHCLLHLQ